MRKFIYFLILIQLHCGQLFAQSVVDKASNAITNDLLKKYIDVLADDSLKGRNTPSLELDKAAKFISGEFEKMGIKKIRETYYQPIPFCTKDLDIKNSHLRIETSMGVKDFALKSDFTPFETTQNGSIKGEIVFVGYGITAPEYNYDDYKDLDVKGKIVLALKHEPGENDPKSVFNGDRNTIHSMNNVKLQNAQQHGAIGVLLVNDPLNHLSITPQGYPWPALSKFYLQDNLPVELCTETNAIPFAQVGSSVIDYIFGSVDSLKNIQKKIDENLVPQSRLLDKVSCDIATRIDIKQHNANNVIGFIEGRGWRLKKEIVVIGGHYDHVGYMKKKKEGEDYIFNGADDNASGTAGVMAIAKAMTSISKRPKRSILFILFAGEEKGLVGANYYCAHPLFPLEKTVAMFNLDMIGRNGNDTLQIEGIKFNPDLAKIVLDQNRRIGLKLVPGEEDLFGRSDHYEFFKKGVSAMDITSGLHKDYHTVRDNPNTINHTKASKITQLTFRSVWVVANQRARYKTIKP